MGSRKRPHPSVYARYPGLTVVQDIFFGVGPAVLAIMAIASYKLARDARQRRRGLRAHPPLMQRDAHTIPT
jgi:chromate transport protein ChrA